MKNFPVMPSPSLSFLQSKGEYHNPQNNASGCINLRGLRPHLAEQDIFEYDSIVVAEKDAFAAHGIPPPGRVNPLSHGFIPAPAEPGPWRQAGGVPVKKYDRPMGEVGGNPAGLIREVLPAGDSPFPAEIAEMEK